MELVFSLYLKDDVTLFDHVLTALQLVEDDYLGGQGSRGSGKVAFRNLTATCKAGTHYVAASDARFSGKTLAELVAARMDLQQWVSQSLAL